jgi:L-threonylcarbamoyladenylate synthase
VRTEVVLVSEKDEAAIRRAAERLRAGEVVAFPTETVYGLGADAENEAAVRRIFEVKGRPPDRALICHVDSPASAKTLLTGWDDRAETLAAAFWPGPLTFVLPKRPEVADVVTGGGPTVAVRSPNHPVALALIRALGRPIAAPSANRTARISPTRAEHVRADLDGLIPMILDAGPTSVGLESTVLDLSGASPTILRQGAITRAAIEAYLKAPVGLAEPARSLSTPLFLFEGAPPEGTERRNVAILRITRPPAAESKGSSRKEGRGPLSMGVALPNDPEAYAQALYEALRSAESLGVEAIWVEMPPTDAPWSAVVARLRALARP